MTNKDFNPMDRDGDYRLDRSFEQYFQEKSLNREAEEKGLRTIVVWSLITAAAFLLGFGTQIETPAALMMTLLSGASCWLLLTLGGLIGKMLRAAPDHFWQDISEVKFTRYADFYFMREMINLDRSLQMLVVFFWGGLLILGLALPYIILLFFQDSWILGI